MSTVTIYVHSDRDKDLLKKLLESAKFNDEVEIYEDENEFTDEDIAEFDRRMAELEKDPSKAISLDDLKKEMKARYGLELSD
jgi:putative addiction module component (TIGR02574 family)